MRQRAVEAIGDKFLANDSGWFNIASFIMVNLKPKYRKLLVDASRPERAQDMMSCPANSAPLFCLLSTYSFSFAT